MDTFSCRAFDTWFPFKIVGGIKKDHPDAADLAAAQRFAENLHDPTTCHHTIQGKLWQQDRGIGGAFGYNERETDADYATPQTLLTELV